MNRKLGSRVFLLALSAAACAPETVERPPEAPINWSKPPVKVKPTAGKATDKERAAADAYTSALSSDAFAQLGATLNEEAHFTFAGAKDAHGREDVVQAHAALFGAFDSRKFVASRRWITESAQALEWTMTGVQARDWMGVAATHREVVIKGLTLLWTNDDGSIVDAHVYFDEAVVKTQLGAGPKELQDLPVARPASPPPHEQEFEQTEALDQKAQVDVVRTELEALEKGDEAGYLSSMADDVECVLPERAQPLRGKEEARAYFRDMRKAINGLDTAVENAWGIGQFVVVEYSIVGEQAGRLNWIPFQKDRLLKLQQVDVVEIANGKIAHVWRYENPSQVLSAP